jgi:tRNA-splicing ligase RtcB
LVANIDAKVLKPFMQKLATEIFHSVPSGVGRGGKLKLDLQELDNVLHDGAPYMLSHFGYGDAGDIEFCEEKGCMVTADPSLISERAKKRGCDQLGTLGAGNHFLEVQVVDKIYDEKAAKLFGLAEGLATVMIHCGSRGLGHQTCTDYVRLMIRNYQNGVMNCLIVNWFARHSNLKKGRIISLLCQLLQILHGQIGIPLLIGPEKHGKEF